jgi:hypothetical protein
MNRKSDPLVTLAMATIAGLASAQESGVATTASLSELAATDYERGHWREAFAGFSALADSGEPEPARIAVLMWRYGPKLYRISFAASPEQLQRWSQLAAGAKVTGCITSTRRAFLISLPRSSRRTPHTGT